jgi:hypothetical protein
LTVFLKAPDSEIKKTVILHTIFKKRREKMKNEPNGLWTFVGEMV